MAETEPHSEVLEDTLKGLSKTKALNGHSTLSEKELDEKSNCSDKMENGDTECKSPQLNGDISDKSALDKNCELPKDDTSCTDEQSSELSISKDDIPKNGKTATAKGDGSSDSAMESCDNNSDAGVSDKKATTSDSENNKSVICTSNEVSDSENNDTLINKDSIEGKSKESDKEAEVASNEDKSSELKSSGDQPSSESGKDDDSEIQNVDESDDKKDLITDSQESEKDTDVSKDKESDKKDSKESETDSKVSDNKKAESVEKETPKKKNEPKPEIVKRVTRSSSGVSKPVKYIDPDPKGISDDDDDIKITKEVKKDEESDIEMIEESDPLAISDADVKKAKEANKVVPLLQDRLKSLKQRDILHKGKDQSNVIIIDTNTLLKGQGTITSGKITGSVSASAQTTGSGNATSTNIQTAIQAITGGNPAIQGLQSAYLNAIQQVLVAQGGSQVSNPHYIATLQQYYNTLGALQDDAYVIEAPSFIVPYVMEGKPVESIKDFLERMIKELEEEEEKKKEEELKKKEEAAAKEKEKEKEEKGEDIKEDDEGGGEEGEEEGVEEEEEGGGGVEEEKMDTDEDKKEEKMDTDEDKKEEKMVTDEDKKEEKMVTDEDKKEEKGEEAKEADEKSETEDKENKDKSKTKDQIVDDDDKENKKEPPPKKEDEEEVIDLDKEPEKPKEDMSHLGRWEGYYRSALGKFFLELGLSHTQEFIQSDLLRMQKRRIEKKTNPSKQDIISVKTLERQTNVSKKKNAHLHVPLKTCKFCSFKTESGLVMERHLESPHMVNYTYKCNFCAFETRGPQVILFHTEAEHNVRGRLERAPAFFQCPLCPFEDNNKSKMTRHSFSCTKKFKADKNSELPDWEPPAKIPKIHRGRPNSFGKTFDTLKMPNILPKNLGGLSLNLQNAISSGLLGSAASASASMNSIAGRGRGRPVGSYKNITQPIGNRAGSLMYQNRGSSLLQPMQGVSSAQQLSIANQVLQSVTQGASNRVPRILPASSAGSLIPSLAASSSITIQSVQNKSGTSKSPQQPSISITPLPRGGTPSSGNKSTTTSTSSNNSQRPAFVICEICDGYIKDLEQLRNHMNLIHKVKIHPKMIYNRPPLNCQKCQHRFFTDQGLERHLLGTHGLVTSSMQEAANKGKDAGRCPICGKVFQWKLLNHVSRDHKMTLKPAHLSYKCTVCTATFNMYRLFENHVYSAHSVVNKNKSSEGNSNTSSAPAKKPSAGSETPLKINDEITIIPQPASKSPKSESKSSPKKSESPAMSKEITITKVGSRSSRRNGNSSSSSSSSSTSSNNGGGGVEVISLDDSPQKRQAEEPPKKRTRETATSKRARTST